MATTTTTNGESQLQQETEQDETTIAVAEDDGEDFLALEVKEPQPDEDEQALEGYDSMEESPSSDDDNNNNHARRSSSKRRRAPWMMELPRATSRNNNTIHPLTTLHNEIVSFVKLMEPLPSEIQQREALVDRIRATVQTAIGPHAQVQVFGSQATGLMLPTSDIDCVVITTEGTANANGGENTAATEQDYLTPLQKFYMAMQQPEWKQELSYLEKLEHTRIPLVKFTQASSQISVDISFDQPSGPPAAQLMKAYLEHLPPLRPLTFVLKYFLAARGLNEPYSGGVGSFMLQLLIVAFLQHRERDAVNYNRNSPYNLGALLLDFLEMYGLEFNFYTTGISVRYDGFFFPKGASDRRNVFVYNNRREPASNIVALENPLDPTLNVGAASFRFQTVQRAFAVAFSTLLAHVTAHPNEYYYQQLKEQSSGSLLATILPPTDYMTGRVVWKRRDRALAAKRPAESDDDDDDDSDYGSSQPEKKKRRRRRKR